MRRRAQRDASLRRGARGGEDDEDDDDGSDDALVVARPPRPRWVAEYELVPPTGIASSSAREASESYDSDDDPTSDPPSPMPEFEELPLHFPRKRGDRALYEEWDFLPLAPPPPPPAEVLRASFASTPGVSAAAATAKSRGLDVASVDSTADALTAVSGEVVTALDRLLATLKSRDEEATREASARTAEEEEKLRRATVRVAVAHAAAAAGDVDATLAFDAAVRRGCEEALGDVLDSLRWWYGAHLRDAAIRIQRHFRGWRGWKHARTRKKGLMAGLAYMRHTTLFVRFGAWRVNAAARRVRLITEAADTRRVWARRRKVFESWRNRAERGAAFRVGVERLAVAIAWRRAAPIFVTWRVAARRRGETKTRRRAASHLRQSTRKILFFPNVGAHRRGIGARARPRHRRARPRREGDGGGGGAAASRATEAWAAARRVADSAAAGRFALAQREARIARARGGDGGDVPTRRRRGGERRRAGPRRRR